MKRDGLVDHLKFLSSMGIPMVPFPDSKILYMKAPRTGGTSILNKLQAVLKSENQIKWIETITDKELEDYFIFAFVRNPWDRLLSIAKYFGYKPKHVLSKIEVKHPVKRELIRTHSFPCSLFTHKDGKQFVDEIFRFESLQSDFSRLCDMIGINKMYLEHLSKTRDDRNYTNSYSVGGRLDRLVRETYKDDIELLGYKF